MTVSDLIEAWPRKDGERPRDALARDLGFANAEAVRIWQFRGVIPREYRHAVVEAANIRGIRQPDGRPIDLEFIYRISGGKLPRAAVALQQSVA